MHTSRVTNFASSKKPFATVVVSLGTEEGDMQISSSMSSVAGSDVTMFFSTVEEISQFATNLLDQAKAEEKECTCECKGGHACPCENCTCSKEGK